MYHSLLKYFFVLFSCYIANSQINISIKIDSIKEIDSPQKRIQKFITLLEKQDTTKTIKGLEKLYGEISSDYIKIQQYDSVVFYAKKAIKTRKQVKNKDLDRLNIDRYRLAYGYKNLNKKTKWYQVLQQIIKSNGNDEFTYRAYRDISRIERDKGDPHKSLQYLNAALANKELCNTLYYELNIRLLIITTYAQKYESNFQADENNSDLDIINKHYQRIEQQFQFSNLREEQLFGMYNNLAIIFDAFGELENALNLYKKAKDFYFSRDNKVDAYSTLMNIGIIYSKQQKFKKAATSFQKILNETTSIDQKATAYDNLGYYLNSNLAKDKIPYFQKAINTSLGKKIAINHAFKLPKLKTIENSGNIQDILIYAIDLAQYQVKAFEQENATVHLENAKQTLLLIDKLVSLIRYESNSEQSKLFWIEKGVDSYMLAVEVAFLLNDHEQAFYYMEKNKALLLQENIRIKQAKENLNIPKSISTRGYHLYYKRLNTYKKLEDNPDDITSQQAFTKQDVLYTRFIDSIQLKYPEYAKIKKEVDIVNYKDIANGNTNFIEYILDDNNGYGLFYNKNETLLFKISNVPEFQKKLHLLKTFFRNPLLNKEEKIALQKTSFSVFNTLFPFPNAKEKLLNKKLTVIPDQNLQTFPFEALSTSQKNTLSESYLVHSTEVSYLQSFSVFEQIKKKKNNPNHKLLLIAPHQFEKHNLLDLTGSKAITKSLSQFKSSTILFEKEATKTNFQKYINDYEIIHINTHAGIDSLSQPWIVFRDYKMPLHELYGLQNQAELVVLDACQTNTGKLAIGEGVISLSRGFFFNGSQSVLASLWNVNEKAGNTILNQFYKEMQNGYSKSKALQLSKIKYLKNHQFSEVLPFYWSAFTLTGSTNKVILQSKFNYTYLFISVFILIVLSITIYYIKTSLKAN
ncbi:CHAT domain-containing protein [uncultured Lacinutrix sp.]|uniref:CHAT domain-containing protein n=1 Tax=uncultured Lacinutrix sp. TaxID=574032 RepID=UPI00263739E4|nr:CHAT domain-containing tetratricopeptide repeat protein [uncultured Lacinutrix sp.]